MSYESLDNSGSLEVESAPSDSASHSSLGDHSSGNLGSNPLSVSSSVDGESQALSGERFDNLGLGTPADSLGDLSLSVESAFVCSSFESSDSLGSFEGTSPDTFSELSLTSSEGLALLSLSQESSDNLGSLEQESALWSESPWSSA